MKKAIKITSTLLLILLALAAGTVIYFVATAKGDIEKVPSVLGYKPLTILSNSMQPAFNAGDVILINVNSEPTINDVITFKHPDGMLVTHRLIESTVENGETFYIAKGDNNNVKDDVLIPRQDILGVQKVIVPGAGYVAKFVAGPIGFFLLIAIPLLIFVSIVIFEKLGVIGQPANKEEEETEEIIENKVS